MKTLKRNNDSKYAKYRKLKSIKKSKNMEMKILLNAEQFKKYEENEEKRNKEKLNKGFFLKMKKYIICFLLMQISFSQTNPEQVEQDTLVSSIFWT